MKNSMKNSRFSLDFFKSGKGIKIENLIFFHEKKELLIARGGRMRLIKIDENGKILVNIRKFDSYFLDIKTFEVFSFVKGKKHLILPLKNRAQKTYSLYRNGVAQEVTFFSILKENMEQIEAKFI